MGWEVEYTDEFGEWWDWLSQGEQEGVAAAVETLEEMGPGLGRPLVDTVRGSRYPHMKELRPPGGNIRILFAFDPARTAILLLGGDKTGEWNTWYRRMIPVADSLYEEHLRSLQGEGQHE